MKAWDAEKEKYELKSVGRGVVAYMLKPEERGAEPPHWLCPTCYAKGEKAFFQATGATIDRMGVYKCAKCQVPITAARDLGWL